MRQVCALLMALMFLSAPVATAFAGGSAYRLSQARARRAYLAWEQKMAQFWKKFDTEMALMGAERDTPRRKSLTPQSNERHK